MKKLLPLFLLATLSGCDLGEGSKLESLEIVSASGATITGSHQMYPCFRDRLNVIGRFTNGDSGNFSTRVAWSSSNPAVVRVLNGSELNTRAVFSNDGGLTIGFNDINGLFYTAGTIVPKGVGAATVTATFLGLTKSVTVNVNSDLANPISLSATPVEGMAAPASLPTVVGFARSLTARAVLGGQTTDAVLRRQDPGTLELLNPILWQFATLGTFSPGVTADDVALDREDLFLFDGTRSTTNADGTASPGTQKTTLNPASGVYRAIAATAAPVVNAVFDTDATKGVFCPTSPIALPAPVEAFASLELSHEADFNGAGVVENGDLVIGTDEVLKTVANPAGANQDVSTQVGYEVIPADRDFCVSADPACAAPVSSILAFNFNQLSTVPGTNGSFVTNTVLNPGAVAAGAAGNARFFQDSKVDPVLIRACAPTCSSAAPLFSANNLSIRAIPATLAVDKISISPDAAANTTDTAFEFPGEQFQAFATFTASSADLDNRFSGPQAMAAQNVSRYMNWFARPTGSTTEVSNLLSLFGLYTTTSNAGQAYYLRNPDATTTPPLVGASVDVDITATPASSTRIGAFPNAATTTVPPSRLTITPAP
ncbi:MAG: hypothetical protein AABY95_07655 [Pseudomonadota bacterium]